eukprot:2004329-Prymnesium_polylepis.1
MGARIARPAPARPLSQTSSRARAEPRKASAPLHLGWLCRSVLPRDRRYMYWCEVTSSEYLRMRT